MKLNKLTPEEENVILRKGTEKPFSGKFNVHHQKGVYTCRQCEERLYNSSSKFDSACGWPSFEAEIPGAIKKVPDSDGIRTEISCSNCGAHLGHVFEGENLTEKNARHCVNSVSLDFIPERQNIKERQKKAYFAGGCFWGVEHHFQNQDGVISTNVGYMGGHTTKPTYVEVSMKKSRHAEVVEVIFDSLKVSYEKLVQLFFEIHDFTQVNRQGPDVGDQYRSEIFFVDENQEEIAQKIIDILKSKKYKIVTRLSKAGVFWLAEDYHQKYYKKNQSKSQCHTRKKIF